jgi:thermitase
VRSTFTAIAVAALVAAAMTAAPANAARTVPGQLIVSFADGASSAERARAHAAAGGRVTDRIAAIDADVVRVRRGGEASALARYRKQRGVVVAERDKVMRAFDDDCGPGSPACYVPSDPFYPREWGLQNDAFTLQPDASADHDADIDAPYAWSLTHGSPTTRIAVLDSGIDQNHEDLSAKIVANRNFSSSKTVDDKYGHGTHVAGTAAAISDNSTGVAGIAFEARLMNVKVLSDSGSGPCSAIANGMTWAADNGAQVINMSLGGGACTAEQNAVNYAWNKGVLLAAAAGNSGAETVSCPACYANTIAVAATDNDDLRADFSNYGPGVDMAAPGKQVFSTFPNHRNKLRKMNYDYGSGTSMATPHVAGATGLIWSNLVDTNANGRLNDEVRSTLETYADDIAGTGTLWSAGRLNVCRALTAGTACAAH